MKRLIGLMLFLLVLTSCNMLLDTNNAAAPLDQDCSDLDTQVVNILFIGNSYISHNNLPKVFKDLACSKGIKTKIYSIAVPNYRFLNHAKDQATLDLIDHTLWDFVILQNHGQVPSFKTTVVTKNSLPYAKILAEKINARFEGTQIIYLQTWGRVAGDMANCINYALVCDLSGHTQALEDGYKIYAEATKAEIAYVGNAFLHIFNDKNSPINPSDLWHQDGAHSSFAGTYLAASVIFAKVFNSSPAGAMLMNNLEPAHAQYLQEIAGQIN